MQTRDLPSAICGQRILPFPYTQLFDEITLLPFASPGTCAVLPGDCTNGMRLQLFKALTGHHFHMHSAFQLGLGSSHETYFQNKQIRCASRTNRTTWATYFKPEKRKDKESAKARLEVSIRNLLRSQINRNKFQMLTSNLAFADSLSFRFLALKLGSPCCCFCAQSAFFYLFFCFSR